MTSEKDMELLFEALLRLKFGHDAGRSAASREAIAEDIAGRLAECS